MMGLLSQASCYWDLEQRRRQVYLKVALLSFSIQSVSVKLFTSKPQFGARAWTKSQHIMSSIILVLFLWFLPSAAPALQLFWTDWVVHLSRTKCWLVNWWQLLVPWSRCLPAAPQISVSCSCRLADESSVLLFFMSVSVGFCGFKVRYFLRHQESKNPKRAENILWPAACCG